MAGEGHDLTAVNHFLHERIVRLYDHAQELNELADIEILEGDLRTSKGAAKARHALYTLTKYICIVMISDLENQLNMVEGMQEEGNGVDELRNDLFSARGNLQEIQVELSSAIETEREFAHQD